jgi:hypothetical protein
MICTALTTSLTYEYFTTFKIVYAILDILSMSALTGGLIVFTLGVYHTILIDRKHIIAKNFWKLVELTIYDLQSIDHLSNGCTVFTFNKSGKNCQIAPSMYDNGDKMLLDFKRLFLY